MTILPLSIELTKLALTASGQYDSAPTLLREVERTLGRRTDLLGHLTQKKQSAPRHLGGGLQAQDFLFSYEHRSLLLQLVRLGQRGGWEVKGFRFL